MVSDFMMLKDRSWSQLLQSLHTLIKTNEKNGILDFQKIISRMPEFDLVEFGIEDIVRSGLVKSYLISKIELGM